MTETVTADEIKAMTPRQYRVYENSLRCAAKRQGLRSDKSHCRDHRALHNGTDQLVTIESGELTSSGLPRGNRLGIQKVQRALPERHLR